MKTKTNKGESMNSEKLLNDFDSDLDIASGSGHVNIHQDGHIDIDESA